ncbi:hypothetical protein V6N13_088530 [Hibiscus sabdariffa]
MEVSPSLNIWERYVEVSSSTRVVCSVRGGVCLDCPPSRLLPFTGGGGISCIVSLDRWFGGWRDDRGLPVKDVFFGQVDWSVWPASSDGWTAELAGGGAVFGGVEKKRATSGN